MDDLVRCHPLVIFVSHSQNVHNIIGASLSEPHTRELGGEISVRLYACLLACIRRTSRANCRSECSRVHGRTTADSKSTSHRFDTGK